ncbi:MAG: carboxylating nicotinate-nucleotide diphosphorylase [Coriobacteriia bacterium]|nr:carboxylating nicotinate-nucleotide diphosphorylase [Coriobacteriia bacterium]
MFELPDIVDVVAAALAEDLGVAPSRLTDTSLTGPDLLELDVTTFSTVGIDAPFSGTIVAREAGVVAGLPVAAAVFEMVSNAAGLFEPVEMFPLVAEGAHVEAGTAVAEVEGLAAAVLMGERTALDFVMLLSGIATETARWVEAAGQELAVFDTRKTVPGLRSLSKYAVRVGGGSNHRTGLGDMVLVKDNHLRHVGITEAVRRARDLNPDLMIEVEADTRAQALEGVEAGADVVMLDNMDDEVLSEAVRECRSAAAARGRAIVLEASGGIRVERLHAIAAIGVDRVSSSALTLASPVDFGLDER